MRCTNELEHADIEGFADAGDPKAVMLMAGCYGVCANGAFQKEFKLGVDEYPRVVRSSAEYRQFLNDDLPRLIHNFEDSQGRGEHPLCICERLNAVIALTSHHCIFETVFRELRADQWDGLRTGFAFLGRGVDSDGQTRTYQVYTVYCNRVKSVSAGKGDSSIIPLETRVVATGMQVRMITVDTRNELPALLHVSVIRDGKCWIKEQPFTVRRALGYERADQFLRVAVAQLRKGVSPSQVEQSLQASLSEIDSVELDYEAVRGVIHHLFNGAHGSLGPRPEQLIHNIEKILPFLFDALVLVELLAPRLHQRLVNELSTIPTADAQSLIYYLKISGALPSNDLQAIDLGKTPSETYLHSSPDWKNTLPQSRVTGGERVSSSLERGNMKEQEHRFPHSAFAREAAAFNDLSGVVRQKYVGQHVAIFGGQVIGSDRDKLALFHRIRKVCNGEFVLLQYVSPDLDAIAEVDTLGE